VKEREDVEASSLLVAPPSPAPSIRLRGGGHGGPDGADLRRPSLPLLSLHLDAPPPDTMSEAAVGEGGGGCTRLPPRARGGVEMGKPALGTKAAPTRSARGRRRRRTRAHHVLCRGRRIFACREVGAGVRASEGGRGSRGGGRR
jgi:hypothetical protein